MLNSLVVFATQKANDFSSGAVTTIDREIIRFFNQLWDSNGWGNFLLSQYSTKFGFYTYMPAVSVPRNTNTLGWKL